MFDKQAQRQRAQALSQNLIAQGHQVPVLPVPKPVAKKVLDCAGQELQVGDRVATTYDGKLMTLYTGIITKIGSKKVTIKLRLPKDFSGTYPGWHDRETTKFPEQVARVQPVWSST